MDAWVCFALGVTQVHPGKSRVDLQWKSDEIPRTLPTK